MKKKTPINKTYSFHSISSPHSFIERAKEEAVKANLNFKQFDNGFDLQINSNHGGRIVYRANVSADDGSGSFISGEIITIPCNSTKKKKNLFQKFFLFFCCIVLLPFLLLYLLSIGIYTLLNSLLSEKNIEETNEEKLCGFMKKAVLHTD